MKREIAREEFPMGSQPKLNFNLFSYSLLGVFALTFFSGIFLTVYYIPTFAQAFPSVERLNEEVPFGWMMRRLHSVGGNFLLILLLLHLLRVFYAGGYKTGPKSAWGIGLLLLILMVWTNFTGFLLPLSQSAFWGTAMVLSNFSSIPWVGSFLVDFLRGGKELGGMALIRFYSMHIGFSAFMALLFFWHGRLGAGEKRAGGSNPQRLKGIWIAAAIAGLLLAAVTFAPNWFSDPLKEAANPLVNPERIFPPWYFLFLEETLKFFAGPYPSWSVVAIISIFLLLFLLPFIDRNPERSLSLRPIPLGLMAAFLVAVVYFSFLGSANARYGEKIVLPDRPLSAREIHGARVFAEKKCAYCHQVMGREGRREGPDMTVVSQRKRTEEWVRRFILNARLYQPGTTMPRYEIPLEDLEALSAYLLSLDPGKGKFRALDRALFLDYGPYLGVGLPRGAQRGPG